MNPSWCGWAKHVCVRALAVWLTFILMHATPWRFYPHLVPMEILPASVCHGGFTNMVVLSTSVPHGDFTSIYSPWWFYQHLFPTEVLPASVPHGDFTCIYSPWLFYHHLFSMMVLPPSTSHGGFTTIYFGNGQRANTLVCNTGQLDGDEIASCNYERV